MGSERHGEMSRMTLTMIASYTATSLNADEPRVELAKWRVGAKRKMERERERESAKLLCFGSLSSLSVCKTITVYIKQHPRVGPVI